MDQLRGLSNGRLKRQRIIFICNTWVVVYLRGRIICDSEDYTVYLY